MQRPSPRFRSEQYHSYTRYPEERFTQIYRDLHEDCMMVSIRMGTNIAYGNQQKHLSPTFATKARIHLSRNL